MRITEAYRDVFEPVVTAMPPRFADRAMMLTADGELRCYGARMREHEDGRKCAFYVVLKSDDCGMSFREEPMPLDHPGATSLSPWSGEYLTLLPHASNIWKYNPATLCQEGESCSPLQLDKTKPEGVYVYRSRTPDGPWKCSLVEEGNIAVQRLPLALNKRKRWICPASQQINGVIYPLVYLSDDDGHSWRRVLVQFPPYFNEITYPHKGYRWRQPGVEPIVAELPSGRLMMLLRTSMDVHYQCFSNDGGETWSQPEPSQFFSVATMPGLYTLSDGRVLAVWNNTTPLPEIKEHEQEELLDEDTKNGIGEDVFTNRDALHAAISDDGGRNWRGFREIALNPWRNQPDFRTLDGNWMLNDKSVHQNQVLELPENKVAIHYGQHPLCTRIMVMDLDFLYATSRKDDFMHGLRDWTTHLYVRSISGGKVIVGHCAWNRCGGAQLMPSPDRDMREALLIGRHTDERLFSDIEGATWNFPAARKGKLQLDVTVPNGTAGLRISLVDRWLNACVEYVAEYAAFSFILDGHGCVNGIRMVDVCKHERLFLQFNLDERTLRLNGSSGRECTIHVAQTLRAPFGDIRQISYLHLQTAATASDTVGTWVHSVEFNML